jgi:hypothetical protein
LVALQKEKEIVEVVDELQIGVEAFRPSLELAIRRIEEGLEMGKEEITMVDVHHIKTRGEILDKLVEETAEINVKAEHRTRLNMWVYAGEAYIRLHSQVRSIEISIAQVELMPSQF